MSLKSNLAKAVAISAVLVTASAGIASAAVADKGTAVHRHPSFNSKIVNYLHRGQHVRLTDREGSWCEISLAGPDGWVRCSALGNYPLTWFRPGITFNFGFGFPHPGPGPWPGPHPGPWPWPMHPMQ